MAVQEFSNTRLRHTAQLLKEDGFGLSGQKMDFTSYMSLQQADATILLQHRLQHLISGLTILDQDHPLGIFNRHDYPHLQRVNAIAHSVMNRAAEVSGVPVRNNEQNITTAIAFLHDLGNNISRKGHGDISIGLFRKLFEKYDPSDPNVKSILTGIKMHDEPVGIKLNDFSDLSRSDPDLEMRPILAVTAADKLDIGRHRLSTTLAGRMPRTFDQIVEGTPHTLVLLYTQGSNLTVSPDGGEAVWDIDFSTFVEDEKNEEARQILDRFIWKNGDIYVPKAWHENWRDHQIPYSVSYLGNMQMLYNSRLAIMLSCLYALFPNLDRFSINVSDSKKYIDAKVAATFHRDNWQEILYMIWKKQNRNAIKSNTITVPPILAKGQQLYKEDKGYSS